MSDSFVATFMQVARNVTAAERGMAVDADLHVQALANLDEETLKTPRFKMLAEITLRQAIDQQEVIITNNIITSPAEAPVTNTSFSDLRMVVVIPVQKTGAVYLDRHIRQGVIAREVLERLHALAHEVLASGQTTLSQEELTALYQQKQSSPS